MIGFILFQLMLIDESKIHFKNTSYEYNQIYASDEKTVIELSSRLLEFDRSGNFVNSFDFKGGIFFSDHFYAVYNRPFLTLFDYKGTVILNKKFYDFVPLFIRFLKNDVILEASVYTEDTAEEGEFTIFKASTNEVSVHQSMHELNLSGKIEFPFIYMVFDEGSRILDLIVNERKGSSIKMNYYDKNIFYMGEFYDGNVRKIFVNELPKESRISNIQFEVQTEGNTFLSKIQLRNLQWKLASIPYAKPTLIVLEREERRKLK